MNLILIRDRNIKSLLPKILNLSMNITTNKEPWKNFSTNWQLLKKIGKIRCQVYEDRDFEEGFFHNPLRRAFVSWLVRFGTGEQIVVDAGEHGVRFLLISGAPLNEPVAWHGPIVMNTQAELRQAMKDLQTGSFIKAH